MPVTFRTKSHASVTQLEHVARSLLQMMGQAEVIPGAMQAHHVASAAAKLRRALDDLEPEPDVQSKADDNDSGPAVSIAQRAQPLLDLLDSAAQHDDYVMWG